MTFSIWLTIYTAVCCFFQKYSQYNHSTGRAEMHIEMTCDCKIASEIRLAKIRPTTDLDTFQVSCPLPVDYNFSDSLTNTKEMR
jgi:hypothetical protein